MKLRPSFLFAVIAAALASQTHSSDAKSQIIASKEPSALRQLNSIHPLPKTAYPQPKWPFNGKNRAQRQRLAAGFFAMA